MSCGSDPKRNAVTDEDRRCADRPFIDEVVA